MQTTIVPETWDIPAQIRERFGESAGRQRAMTADGHLLLVLHEPPGPDDRNRSARLFWRNPQGKWTWTANGSETHLLKQHMEEFTRRSNQLEDQLQTASLAEDYLNLLQAVAPLQRTSRNLLATLQQARELVPKDREIIVARDMASDVERAFELLMTDARNGLDYTVAHRAELQSQQSHEMAQSAHRLNVLAALFLPITAISSIFGMNVKSGLETFPSAWLFWAILGAGFLSGILLTRAISQKPILLSTTKNAKPRAIGAPTKAGR